MKSLARCRLNAPAAGLIIEVDGAQHLSEAGIAADARRTTALASLGLRVLRFDNLQVLKQTAAVMETIYSTMSERLSRPGPIPPAPLFQRGEQQRQQAETIAGARGRKTRRIRSPPLKKGG